jgi:purine-binding chemotaxis protein CheW
MGCLAMSNHLPATTPGTLPEPSRFAPPAIRPSGLGAASPHPELQMVTFFLEGEEYGVDVMQVREIVSMAPITKTANSSYHVEGVINLRGRIVPVLSLRRRLGMTELEDRGTSFIAIMDFRGELTGFVIDEISDVVRVRRSDILPPLETDRQQWIEGILRLGDRLVVVVNLQPLVEE